MIQKWEYKIFASHLDPAELVVILDECGSDGWELVAIAAVPDYLPPEIIEAAATPETRSREGEAREGVHVEAFRYIFKRPLS